MRVLIWRQLALTVVLVTIVPAAALAQFPQSWDLLLDTGSTGGIGFDRSTGTSYWGAWPSGSVCGEFFAGSFSLADGDSFPLPQYSDGSIADPSEVFWLAFPSRIAFSVPAQPSGITFVGNEFGLSFVGRTVHFSYKCIAGTCGAPDVGPGNPRVDVHVFAVRREVTDVRDVPTGGSKSLHSTVVPNPSASDTSLRFYMGVDGDARVRVFDARGRMVRDLGPMSLGRGRQTVQWDGNGEQGQRLGSGVYYFELEVQGVTSRQRVVLLH